MDNFITVPSSSEGNILHIKVEPLYNGQFGTTLELEVFLFLGVKMYGVKLLDKIPCA